MNGKAFMTDTSILRRFILSLFLSVTWLSMTVNAAMAQSLIRDTEIEETLRDFSVPLLRAGGLDPKAVDIYIVNDGSLNAFVTRGQNIFLHTGLILESKTPIQLKGVIAHEAGHIVGGHLVRSDYGRRSAYGSMLIAAGLGLAAILAGEEGAGAAIVAGAPQFGALEILAYTRVNESAADQYAAQFLERTGQSGTGLIQFFEKFRYQEILSNAKRYPYFRSHPLSSERIDALREVVDESPHTNVLDNEEDIYRFEMAKAKLRGFLEGQQLVFSRYPLEDKSDMARYARAVAFYKGADLKNALSEIDSLIATDPENAYYHELKWQILYESGKGAESIAPMKRALELKPDAPLFKISLAQAHLESGDRESTLEAIRLLKSALVTEPKNSSGWYYLSQGYGNMGEDALAKYAIAEQSFSMSNYQRALSFAKRAQQDLRRDIPQWRRASDIVVISETQLAKKRK